MAGMRGIGDMNLTARAHAAPWQRLLAQAITDPVELLTELHLGPGHAASLFSVAATRDFPLRVPRGFVARMRKGDPDDPLLRQVLPAGQELDTVPGFSPDPLGESAASPQPGLLHKYRGRVLLLVAGSCAVHCRYCFRRHFPYPAHRPRHGWRQAVDYIRADATVSEVILSGGDPLTAPDPTLAALARDLAAVPHLRRLRIHTRLPIVLPERVDPSLLDWVTGTRLKPVLVVHANHGNEIDASVAAALGRLRERGVTLLNQAVLLRGVNDSVAAQGELSERLFEAGVLPYYLHLLDRVQGASHFEVAEEDARRLVRELMAHLPGYLVPRLVREGEQAPAKIPVALS